MDVLFKLKHVAKRGRGLVALADIPKHEILFYERPIVAILADESLNQFCAYCFNPLHNNQHKFMNSSHSDITQSDTFHVNCGEIGQKEMCINYAGIRNKHYNTDRGKFPTMARIILGHTLQQMLLYTNHSANNAEKEQPPQQKHLMINEDPDFIWNGILSKLCFADNVELTQDIDQDPYFEWLDFACNESEIVNQIQIPSPGSSPTPMQNTQNAHPDTDTDTGTAAVSSATSVRSVISEMVPYAMYERLMRILHLNSFSICGIDTENVVDSIPISIGSALFGLASFFNHSCVPNVELLTEENMEYESGFAQFRTLTQIKQNEELCIQYAGYYDDNYADRQQYFLHYYGFQCQCPKCLKQGLQQQLL